MFTSDNFLDVGFLLLIATIVSIILNVFWVSFAKVSATTFYWGSKLMSYLLYSSFFGTLIAFVIALILRMAERA